MAVSIRLSRSGRVHLPYYHIRVYDSRTRRDGRPIEELGFFAPEADKETVRIDVEKVKHWLSVGAKPSATVETILKQNGFTSADLVTKKKTDNTKKKKKAVSKKTTENKKPRKPRKSNSKIRGEKKNKTAA